MSVLNKSRLGPKERNTGDNVLQKFSLHALCKSLIIAMSNSV